MSGITLNNRSVSTLYKSEEITKIDLTEGQSLNLQSSAMLACKNVEIKTGFNDSFFGAVKRCIFGGETLFQNTYTAKEGGGWVALEETIPGQIGVYELYPGEALTIGRGCYVASDSNVKLSTIYGGVKGWWSGVGFVKLEATVTDEKVGRVFFDSMNSITKVIKIKEEDGPVIIDNTNLVAYTDQLQVAVRMLNGLKSLFFSGEGIVNEFKGNGLVFVGSGVVQGAYTPHQ